MRRARAMRAISADPTSAAACETCPSPDAGGSAAHSPSSPCSGTMDMPFANRPPRRPLSSIPASRAAPAAGNTRRALDPQHARATARKCDRGSPPQRRKKGDGGSCPGCLRGGRAVELAVRGAGFASAHKPCPPLLKDTCAGACVCTVSFRASIVVCCLCCFVLSCVVLCRLV
jgi:hypothetical protein